MRLPLARYEVSGLAVDEWGFFSLELPAKHGNASKVEIILERLYEEGDPVLFVQKSRKPTQRDYSHCTYEKWREGHPKQWDDETQQWEEQVSTRVLGRCTAPFPPFLIPNRVPHGFTPRS